MFFYVLRLLVASFWGFAFAFYCSTEVRAEVDVYEIAVLSTIFFARVCVISVKYAYYSDRMIDLFARPNVSIMDHAKLLLIANWCVR